MTAEQLAQLFHDMYERLAPEFGYTTRKSSAQPWKDVSEPNKSLMIAVAKRVLEELKLDICPVCGHEWRRHDPETGRCDAPDWSEIGYCQCGRDLIFWVEKNAELSKTALSAS